MFEKILISICFGLFSSSCCILSSSLKADSCACKKFEKELRSLIVYDSMTEYVYFNEHLKLDIRKTDNEPRRIYPVLSPSKIFRDKNCLIGKNIITVKKMFQFDRLLENRVYAILPSIEHHNCLRKEMNCKESNILGEYHSLNIKFSTEDVVKETIITITEKIMELELR